MRFHVRVAAFVFLSTFASSSFAVDLFVDDFDTDSSANWTSNNATNVDSPESQPANYFFDYSTIGIPSAPNSVGGSTRGMKLQANLDFDNDSITGGTVVIGMSVSPTGLDLSSAGDFRLTADVWANYMTNTTNGTSNLITMGVGSNGTTGNYPGGAPDAVWFGAMTDGDTTSDFRAYGPERVISYQIPWLNPTADLDPMGAPIDSHAKYFAGTRNNSGGVAFPDFNDNGIVDAADYTRWRDNLGKTDAVVIPRTDGNADLNMEVNQLDYDMWKVTYGANKDLYINTLDDAPPPPAAQIALFPQQDPNGAGNVNPNQPGTIAFAWHEYRIDKIGNLITWMIDGVPMISVDVTNTNVPLGGSNIMFGMTDQNIAAPDDENRFDLLFALFDNVKVTQLSTEGLGAVAGVPEPSTLLMVGLGVAALAGSRRRS